MKIHFAYRKYEHATYLGVSSVPHDDLVARVQQVLDNATAHDAQTQEPKLHGAGLDFLLQQSLGNVLQVQRRSFL